MDDSARTQPKDQRYVDLKEPAAAEYWMKKWGITAEQLQAAVRAVGTSTKNVAEHLQIGEQG